MKKLTLLLLLITSITFTSCGILVEEKDEPISELSTQLESQYNFYSDSVENLTKEMEITVDEANKIFEILIECGIDEEINYVFAEDDYYDVWAGLKKMQVYLTDNGLVEKVFESNEQIYPQIKSNLINNFSNEIIWKEEDNIGIVNLILDANHTKEVIINNYYTEISHFINSLDKGTLKDYDSLQFVGNVMRDNKIECTIKGSMSIPAIKTYEKDFNSIIVEDNITDLFIPKPLK